jgi:hypothetical protein
MPFLAIRESRRALWRTPEAERDALGVRPIDEREPEQQLVTVRQVVEHARRRRRPQRADSADEARPSTSAEVTQLSSEAILRATFAHRGSKQALLRAIESLREDAAVMRGQLASQAREYADTGGPFPEQLHLIALTGRFLIDYAALLGQWADWAQRHVDAWPSVQSASEVPLDFAYEIFAELTP